MPSLGSLEAYIDAVGRYPTLGAEEERALARRVRREGDHQAAQRLVCSHLRVVVACARRYRGYGLPHADLIQEGSIGLIKAVKRFDPDRGVRLVSFALHWIRAEIHDYVVRNTGAARMATTKAQKKLFFKLRSLKQNVAPLSPREAQSIAAQLSVPLRDVLEMDARLAGRDIAIDRRDGEAHRFELAGNPQDEPAQLLEAREDKELLEARLERAMHNLDARSRRVIEARWPKAGTRARLRELAAQLTVSAERVRQLESGALRRMRMEIGKEAR